MDVKFSEQSRRTIEYSRDEAARLKHDYIGTEHLLLGLLKLGEGVAIDILKDCGVSVEQIRRTVEKVIPIGTTVDLEQLALTARAKKVLELSGLETIALNSKVIEPYHLLLAMVKEREAISAQILEEYDINYNEVLERVKNVIAGRPISYGIPASKTKHKIRKEVDRALDVLASHGRAAPILYREKGFKPASCPIGMSDGKPCGNNIWDGVHQVCVFHSPQVEGKSGTFDEELNRKINEATSSSNITKFDFTRFVFPQGSFSSKVFSKPVYFSWCHFLGEADFRWAVFEKEVDFSAAKFKNNANFYGARFKGKAVFFGATFSMDTNFSEASQSKCFEDEGDLRYLVFTKDSTITFERVDVSRCRFIGTNLERINFLEVNWCKPNSTTKIFRLRKRIVWDEIAPLTVEDTGERNYERIVDNYRQLVLNYERRRGFEAAECFHVGEMELRRLTPKRTRLYTFLHKYLSLTAFYKYVSNYGENYALPFTWLISGVLLFSFLFMFVGLRPTTSFPEYSSFNYDFKFPNDVSGTEFFDDWISSFIYTLQVFSLQRESIFTPQHRGGHLLKVLAYVFSPTVIAFFLLALRRRFKR
ncbi:MAG: Clp protease N-terminal domain-containing protein [Candidatus Zixiibacteriota bacterium]